jgi:hypothetical protein
MRNTKRHIDTSDIPELTVADLKRARRATPKETAAFRRGIEDKLDVSRPPRMGRPPKKTSEKYVHISWRTPPDVMDWLVAQARHTGVGKYQTFLSLLLRGMMRYEAAREKNEITLELPNSNEAIVIASEETLNRVRKNRNESLKKLKDFEERFPDNMSLGELRKWRNYWKAHSDLLAPKIQKLAMKRVFEIESAIAKRIRNADGNSG